MAGRLWRYLAVKLFLSYLAVILVSLAALASAAEFAVPSAFDHHMAAMSRVMIAGAGSPALAELGADLFNSFRAAVNEALIWSAASAFVVAVAVSLFVSRRIVTPVREMMIASRHIAAGHYHERVILPGPLVWNELDELGRLAVSFNQMADRLEKMESTRRELIGNVAHELRTPLATIKGSMEGLIDGVLPADPLTFQQIYRETDRLQRLVADLQELSRVEAGAFELSLRAIAPSKLAQAAAARLERQFEGKGVTLETDVPETLPPVRADEDRIGQVLLNLVGNALQYTPAGGRVKITARRNGGEVAFKVADSGIGIAPEHLPMLFTRFYRIDKSRSRIGGGSGIGLTIARHLVEAHGGRIWVESPGLNQGSVFTFTLPVWQPL